MACSENNVLFSNQNIWDKIEALFLFTMIYAITICKYLHNHCRISWITQGNQSGFWQEEEAPMMTKRFLAASNLTDEWDTSLELSSAWIFRFSFRWIWGEGFIYEDRVRCTVETTAWPPCFCFHLDPPVHRFLTLLSVTDWLAEAGNPCLCNQAAHIHPGGDWGCCDLISYLSSKFEGKKSDKPVQYRLFHRSSLPWWFASSPPTSVWSCWWEEIAKHPKNTLPHHLK